MPTLALSTFADGTAANPVPVEQNFYNPSATGTGSIEIINGHLDNNNRQAGWDVSKEHIQERALSGAGAVGANANLDYFGQVFAGWTPAKDVATGWVNQATADRFYKTIPGAAVEYYLPQNCSLVILSWSVFASSMVDLTVGTDEGVAGSDTRQSQQQWYNSELGARIRLFVDGARSGAVSAKFDVPTMIGCTPGGVGAMGNMVGTFDRWWSSSMILTGASANKGWHSASLRIASTSQKINTQKDETKHSQTRVRCRHMDYVYFL
jgi:hypothetical protein